jgi:hypothetical protein
MLLKLLRIKDASNFIPDKGVVELIMNIFEPESRD